MGRRGLMYSCQYDSERQDREAHLLGIDVRGAGCEEKLNLRTVGDS